MNHYVNGYRDDGGQRAYPFAIGTFTCRGRRIYRVKRAGSHGLAGFSRGIDCRLLASSVFVLATFRFSAVPFASSAWT